MGLFTSPGILRRGEPTLIGVLTALGLTSNLQVCLDAGDENSYTSGQTWVDLSAGTYPFFRGATASVTTDDPTFNGVAGGLSVLEYFSFDGGDYFRQDSATDDFNLDIANAFHKSGAVFSVFAWVKLPGSIGTDSTLLGNPGGAPNDIGINWNLDFGTQNFRVRKSGATAFTANGDTAPNLGAHNFLGLSINEAGGTVSFHYLNGEFNQVGASDLFDASYTSPSASAASHVFEIGALGDTSFLLINGFEISMIGIFNSALTKTNFDDIYAQTRGRANI